MGIEECAPGSGESASVHRNHLHIDVLAFRHLAQMQQLLACDVPAVELRLAVAVGLLLLIGGWALISTAFSKGQGAPRASHSGVPTCDGKDYLGAGAATVGSGLSRPVRGVLVLLTATVPLVVVAFRIRPMFERVEEASQGRVDTMLGALRSTAAVSARGQPIR
ncbi:hypothetical protein [Streptomyces sp. NBC_00984]|uniref:hypothetical protein n=1 Tax=Streptomyces sp. NBC_00984 TaxID=2903700 RepID=UPI003870ED63